MFGDDRGRLTPVDVFAVGVGLFLLGILVVPIYTLLNANAGALGTGDAYLLRMVAPAAVIGAFVFIFQIAIQGR